MNDHDSEVLAGFLEEMGYSSTEALEEADVIILNTCCVRGTAENKVFGFLGQLRQLKVKNPDLIIGVCGCMTQQEEVARKIKQRFPHVDIILGTRNTYRLPELIRRVKEKRDKVLEIWPASNEIIEELPVKRTQRIRALVTIMYGCNNFCTYCIVPYVRGREQSRNPVDIIAEVRQLALNGYKEVTLLGQNVNSYGKDLREKMDFAMLLTELEKIEGIERIRYVTSHPRDFNDKLINVIAKSKKVCEHVHLPVQSGSTRILKMMNRGYSQEEYLNLVSKIRSAVPGISITTDVMVGFPGETDADYADTINLLKEVQFEGAFTFIYNIRPGTPAASFSDQVPEEIKKVRIEELIKLQNKITLAKNKAEEGKVKEVLVEGESKNNQNLLAGRTRTNKMTVFPGSKNLSGKLVNVEIQKGKLTNLEGSIK